LAVVDEPAPGTGQLPDRRHTVSVVVPVYGGERTLPGLLAEIVPLTSEFRTPSGARAIVTEVLLVHDNGPDNSAAVIRQLEALHEFVRPVWLSRNFGQHPATLAGMASSGGDWIVTLDEDGQHNPAEIGRLLDVALTQRAHVVYAKPVNAPPHGFVRNLASKTAKKLISGSSGANATDFQSYRLILGEIGRSVAAYAGSGVYLDVGIGWVAQKIATCPVELRGEGDRPSGYSYRKLLSHFWRMVLSSGTKGLRLVGVLGVIAAVLGVALAIVLLVLRLVGAQDIPQGWPSLMVVLLLSTGAILFALGVVAEYIGVAVNMAMGRPLYLIVSDPADGPLGPGAPAVHAGQGEPAATQLGSRAAAAPARPAH
jgi:undecaprenyl-phosphate 4-deoxy-4-formamido-L-arabinose transferase